MDIIETLLIQAATLTVTGMGVVFIFLTILVYLVRLTSSIVASFDSTIPIETTDKHTKAVHSIDPQIVAVISAAVQQHRLAN